MDIAGKCHCGNISFVLTLTPDPVEIPARACTCSFCIKHGGVWTASPIGVLRTGIMDAERTRRYVFGTRTADFHVCAICGVVPLVTSVIHEREYAVVNANTFENFDRALLSRSSVSFDGEGEGGRLARRAKNWIPDVQHVRNVA